MHTYINNKIEMLSYLKWMFYIKLLNNFEMY